MVAGSPEPAEHWETLYRQRLPTELSWYQDEPTVSLALFDALGATPDKPVVDVGGGASVLVDRLVERRFGDVTVLDLSIAALGEAKRRLGEEAGLVHWLHRDVVTWGPGRRYGVWHDRAVFHFLVEDGQRSAYLATLRHALAPGGLVVMGTFAPDGPEQCSGLPVRRYEPSDLGAVFGASFEVVEHRREKHRTPSGTVQPFTWVGMVYRP